MVRRTQVYEYHKAHGNIVDYAGFELPVWFEGIIPECKSVRNHAGIFDVSHMGRVMVEGPDAEPFLNAVTTNDVSRLQVGRGHYSLLCNPKGGVIDDLTVFRLGQVKFLVVYNAANREKDWSWLEQHRGSRKVAISDVSDDVAMFAVQGPHAASLLHTTSGVRLEEVERYGTRETRVDGVPCLITRSGYTGEDGFETYVWNTSVKNPSNAMKVWSVLLSKGRELGLRPAGLGSRDVLRLEAGMCLYGNDIDESTSPVEAKLGWVVALEKPGFVGRNPILSQKQAGPSRVRVGFRTTERGIPRQGQEIRSATETVGKVTSGTFSPTLNMGIGMGYVKPAYSRVGEQLLIRIRDRDVAAKTVKLPFYQRKSEDRVVVLGKEMGLKEFRTGTGSG